MRLTELFESSEYVNDLRDEIINLLVTASAEGTTQVNTDQVVMDLNSMGYTGVDPITVVQILSGHPAVAMANQDTIKIATTDAERYVSPDVADKEERTISKMAKRQLKKEIK